MARLVHWRGVVAAIAASAVVVAVAGVAGGRADPTPNLPPIPADRLLASTLQALAARTPISGEVRTHVDLGIPELPSGVGGGPTGPADVFLGDQTFKYWRSPDGARLAQILPFAERVIVVTRTDAWAWDSNTFTAWHDAIDGVRGPPAAPSPGDLLMVARRLLEGAAPYADIAVETPTTVAGRDAYVLAMKPTSPRTLVGSVEVAIDAETRLPLRLQIFPRGAADPAVEAGFSSVDFGPVDPQMFAFTPPDGATVKEVQDRPPAGGGSESGSPDVRLFGDGFDLVFAVRIQEVPKDLRPLLPYAGPLGSVALIDRGDHAWLVGGAVGPDALQAVAPKLP